MIFVAFTCGMETAELVAVDSVAAVLAALAPDPTGAATTAVRRISWASGGDGVGNMQYAHAHTFYLPAAHLMLHVPNAMNLETVRAYYNGWYNDIVTERIPITAGMLSLPAKPCLGVALREEVLSWPDARVEQIDL
ncbi:MAG: hypothetical protein OXK78_09760 [Caldilineaceae bacterium]|nr:hypothetical protein [Caldilineaceae bacterium]